MLLCGYLMKLTYYSRANSILLGFTTFIMSTHVIESATGFGST